MTATLPSRRKRSSTLSLVSPWITRGMTRTGVASTSRPSMSACSVRAISRWPSGVPSWIVVRRGCERRAAGLSSVPIRATPGGSASRAPSAISSLNA